jgi:GNAT superfamily N-acetyltransferase
MMLDHADGYSIRSAGGSDAQEVAELVDAAYRAYVERIGTLPGPMTDDYAQVIRDHRVTVVESDQHIVGLIVHRIIDKGFFIDNVAVHPVHRGKGVGHALLEFAEDEARRLGFDSICLYTHEKMSENLAMYSKLGYVEYAPPSGAEPFLIHMRKHLERASG